MIGGTLVATKKENWHAHFKKRFEQLNFYNVTVTSARKDGLKMAINDLKPRILLIGSSFYDCCTPFMMANLHKTFPKLNIAAIDVMDYPADLAMYFILNGVRSYINYWEGSGPEQFYNGLEEIRRGGEYVSPEVQRRIEMRSCKPDPAKELTDKQVEIIRLISNGYTGAEIADTLHMSEKSADNRKSEIYKAINVRNENELIRVAIFLGLINPEELRFFPRTYELKPLPQRKKSNEKRAKSKEIRGIA